MGKQGRHSCGKCHDVVSDIVNEAEAKFRRVVNVLESKLKAEQDLNAEIKARFVKCNTCTPDMKDKCPMFHENLCEGERCEELVDLMSLVEKRDHDDKLAKAKEHLEKMLYYAKQYMSEGKHTDKTVTALIENDIERAEQFLKED